MTSLLKFSGERTNPQKGGNTTKETTKTKKYLFTVIITERNNKMEQAKIIKEALSKVYGYKNVSVRRGSGTACWWTNIRVRLDYADRKDYLEKCQEVEKQAIEALEARGQTPSTFWVDDGYGTEDYAIIVNLEK